MPKAVLRTAECPQVSGALDDLRSYFGRTAGLRLEAGQACYAENRLSSLMQASEAANFSKLLGHLDPEGTGPLARELLEALTCRETWFFRDRAPFDIFAENLLPRLLQLRAPEQTLRIWSAGCSSGQEACSLAMQVDAALAAEPPRNVEIIGTDISTSMIDRAQQTTFSDTEIQQGLPVSALLKYFGQLPLPASRPWQLRRPIARRMQFKTHNLLADASDLGRFDIIFCRNVLSQMHVGAQRIVMSHLTAQLADGGFLVLGQEEEPWCVAGSFVRKFSNAAIFERRSRAQGTGPATRHLRLVSNRT